MTEKYETNNFIDIHENIGFLLEEMLYSHSKKSYIEFKSKNGGNSIIKIDIEIEP